MRPNKQRKLEEFMVTPSEVELDSKKGSVSISPGTNPLPTTIGLLPVPASYLLEESVRDEYTHTKIPYKRTNYVCPDGFINADIFSIIYPFLEPNEQWRTRRVCKDLYAIYYNIVENIFISIGSNTLKVMPNFWNWLQITISNPKYKISQINIKVDVSFYYDVISAIQTHILPYAHVSKYEPIWSDFADYMITPFPHLISPFDYTHSPLQIEYKSKYSARIESRPTFIGDFKSHASAFECIGLHFKTQLFKNVLFMISKTFSNHPEKRSITCRLWGCEDYSEFTQQLIGSRRLSVPKYTEELGKLILQDWCYFGLNAPNYVQVFQVGNPKKDSLIKPKYVIEDTITMSGNIENQISGAEYKHYEKLVIDEIEKCDAKSLKSVVDLIEKSNIPHIYYAILSKYLLYPHKQGILTTVKKVRSLCQMICETNPEKFPVDDLEGLIPVLYKHQSDPIEVDMDDMCLIDENYYINDYGVGDHNNECEM